MGRRELTGAAVGALAAAVTATGIAWASGAIPGADGVIQGCYDSGGNVKVVAALPCPKGYTSLPWSQLGTKGDKGDKGDPCLSSDPACAGPKGDKGEKGDKGDKGDPCLSSDPACVGPKGDKGDQGDPGPSGSGLTGRVLVSASGNPHCTQTNNFGFCIAEAASATATCPTGKIATGGGSSYSHGADDQHFLNISVGPTADGTGWSGSISSSTSPGGGGDFGSISVTVVCYDAGT